MKFITTPGRLIKSEIACDDGQMLPAQVAKLRLTIGLRSAPGAQCEGSSSGTSSCILSPSRAAAALSKASSATVLPDRIPSGNSGISELSRIYPPASCEAPEHLAHYLPVWGSSCPPPPAVNYATAVFKMKAQRLEEHKQGRPAWAAGERGASGRFGSLFPLSRS